jgi:tRNA threonylcarbamoyladenosine biosynthesis protein TsaB
MLTLALDTTGEFGSIALADESGVRAEALIHAPQGFGQVLFPRVQALLDAQSVTLRDIELLAAASGPGSFTGVRVGLAAMKGLAHVLGVRAAGVSNLAALAGFGTGDLRATIIDARRGEVYAALYDAAGKPVIAECVISFPRWLEVLPNTDLEWVATDFQPFQAALVGTRFEDSPVTIAPRALAGAIAGIAICRALGGEPLEAAAIEANYVRKSDAELLWKEASRRPAHDLPAKER